MSNKKRRCAWCLKKLPRRSGPRRIYCGDRCRWSAASAAYRERHRADYNRSKAEAMRRLRIARKIERLRMQALRREKSKRRDATPEEAGVVFMYLLRCAAAGRRGEDVVERWRARGVSQRISP